MAVESGASPRANGEIEAATTGPIVISGMKCPSPTSKWKTFAPTTWGRSSSTPRREKSDA